MYLTNVDDDLAVTRGTIILGVAASDAHVVANHLIAMFLRRQDFSVINLGACTPTEEFMKAAVRSPNVVAILIGSLNGHAAEDLADLPMLRQQYQVRVPVLVGGNLSVGAIKSDAVIEKLLTLGVDAVLQHPDEIIGTLHNIKLKAEQASPAAIPLQSDNFKLVA